MSLNGIDVSAWQKGIDLGAVPCDFVLIKATEGISYVSPACDAQYQSAKRAGKKLGVYHYAAHGGAKSEAQFFVSHIRGYLGEALLVLDWEKQNNANFGNPAYAVAFLDEVYRLTGTRPLIYMSKSMIHSFDWQAAADKNYGLWAAQYADNRETGYQARPWTDSSGWGPWAFPAIYQYSSHGRLSGWGGNLDLDIFYGGAGAWDAYAKGRPSDTMPPSGDVPFSDRPVCFEKHFGVWAKNIRDSGSGIDRVLAAVWSEKGGQDDIRWYPMIPGIDGRPNDYAVSIDADEHGGVIDGNTIICDVYARDRAGNQACLGRAVTEMTTKLLTPLGRAGNVYYRAHVQNIGWQAPVGEGMTAGTVGRSLRMEALAVRSNIDGLSVRLQGHVEKYGWMQSAGETQAVGTVTQSLRLEAVRMVLEGDKAGDYDIVYRAHVQGLGWLPWVKNGKTAGTEGKGLRMEAVEIKIRKKKTEA